MKVRSQMVSKWEMFIAVLFWLSAVLLAVGLMLGFATWVVTKMIQGLLSLLQ